jgi:hypothetical protein
VRAGKLIRKEFEYISKEVGSPKIEASPFPILDLRFYANEKDQLQTEGEYWNKALTSALAPKGIRRSRFNKDGFVAFALPPTQNRRLSCQQGAFLFNGAEELTFNQSLLKMMESCERPWCRRFEIPASILPDVESQLFKMNVHDLSLFPDMEGLAGFIRQKARLHWIPG